jgi:hypothetical protein
MQTGGVGKCANYFIQEQNSHAKPLREENGSITIRKFQLYDT